MAAPISYYGKLFTNTDITPAIAKAANVAKTFGLALVKARTPVDTSKLKGNWEARLEGNGIRFTNDTPYAGFVEFGTRKMSPRAMLTRSLIDIEEVFIEELYKDIGSTLGADIISGYQSPGYDNAVKTDQPDKYPQVGNKLQPKIRTGLSKNSKKTSKNFLFSNPADILNGKQKAIIAKSKPLLQKKKSK